MQLFDQKIKPQNEYFFRGRRKFFTSSLPLNGKNVLSLGSGSKSKEMAQITDAQRYTISVMLRKNYQRKDICEAIGVSKSVLSREISRNKNPKTGTYSYTYAKMAVSVRKERYKNPRIFTKEVKAMVEGHLREDWSPEQIAGYCKAHGIKVPSIERIYQHIRQDKKNGGDLYKHCRHQLKHRARQVGKHMPIKDRVSIDDRPAEADGARFGDYEMDLIVGPGNKDAMLTLAERSTCMCFISNLPNGKNSKGVSQAAIRKIFAFRNTIKSITTDNGPEFAEHKEIAKKLKTTVYFAHPYHSWENTNSTLDQGKSLATGHLWRCSTRCFRKVAFRN